MQYLQSIFTTLWTLWNHRNRVVHEGIQPNPIEVILTAQNFSCRYQNIFTNATHPNQQRVHLLARQVLGGIGRFSSRLQGGRGNKPTGLPMRMKPGLFSEIASSWVFLVVLQKLLWVLLRKPWWMHYWKPEIWGISVFWSYVIAVD